MSSDHRLALDNCIKCSICVSHCPVARVTDKFAGPKQNGPDLERFRLEEPAAVHPSIGYCTNCKGCDVVCPSGVAVSAMNCRARGEYVSMHGAPLRDKILARVDRMGKAARLAPSLVNRLAGLRPLRLLAEKMLGISAAMTMPRYAQKTFLELYKPQNVGDTGRKVLYYPGCYVNYNAPEVGLALAEVLAHNNIRVEVEQFDCCGLPLIANGLLDTARDQAKKNLAKLQGYINRGYDIVTTCPSCHLTLRQEYRELFQLNTDPLHEKMLDVFEYLSVLLQQGKLVTRFEELPLQVGYHQPCHLKAAGCGVPSREILQLIPGLRVADLDAGCCGLAGTYGFKKEKYAISQAIGSNVFNAVKELGVRQVISECGMCQLQIHHLTGVAVYHPLQVLAQACGHGKWLAK
ncbi:anaerobic glycerol-3-phosphate dehydrogenase subunit C [Desulforamulus ferrireducens]|uniref:sn-glycerol-3-phosphate dehydrogenase subunit C n=1 Tax=Desulforamulus ferrireducens TaxID=1833852 RepID=A0A1S6IWI6_9FIRM|nr:anaerobic glycerol-3-phosphate dehydrogenase subunit C [Desulforamulus ferrireducens]AQS59144.1 sn-glycerol-3-phosphate dehydrogenase subunit C [Desulforamulus ferrireducens]